MSNEEEIMETMVSLEQDSKELEHYHRDRYQHCFFLMLSELWSLKDEKVSSILDKYSCGLITDEREPEYRAVSLRFPISFNDADLPLRLQAISKPQGEQKYFIGKATSNVK